MESDKSVKLSKEERGEIFEIVNSQYLNFKGAKKKSFKQNFKSVWKEDNNLFKLVMTLYNAEDIIEGRRVRLEEEIEGGYGIPLDWETKKVPWKRHHGYITHCMDQVHSLEKQLEDVEEGKGYIPQELHEEKMKELKQEQQEIIREQGDKIAKLRQSEQYARDKKQIAENKLEEVRKFYETQMDILIKGQEKAEQ